MSLERAGRFSGYLIFASSGQTASFDPRPRVVFIILSDVVSCDPSPLAPFFIVTHNIGAFGHIPGDRKIGIKIKVCLFALAESCANTFLTQWVINFGWGSE